MDNKHLEPLDFTPKSFKDLKFKWYEYLEIWFHRFIRNPIVDTKRYIERFFQRGIRGWGQSDLWNMHDYLTDVILNMLIELKRTQCGIPVTKDPITGKWGHNEARWNTILDTMISGFTVLKRCSNGDVEWGGSLTSRRKASLQKNMRKNFPDWTLTTREEEDKVKEAFKLFTQYYQNLWD